MQDLSLKMQDLSLKMQDLLWWRRRFRLRRWILSRLPVPLFFMLCV
jgi:hypothetical protein